MVALFFEAGGATFYETIGEFVFKLTLIEHDVNIQAHNNNPIEQVGTEVFPHPKMVAYCEEADRINKLAAELYDAFKKFVYSREDNPAYGKISCDVTTDKSIRIEITQITPPSWFRLAP